MNEHVISGVSQRKEKKSRSLITRYWNKKRKQASQIIPSTGTSFRRLTPSWQDQIDFYASPQ
jgi:hypothetical protein